MRGPPVDDVARHMLNWAGKQLTLYRPVRPDSDLDGNPDEDLLGHSPDGSGTSTAASWEKVETTQAYRQYEDENETDRDGRGNFSEDAAQLLVYPGVGEKGWKAVYDGDDYMLLSVTHLHGYDIWDTDPLQGGGPLE